MRKLKMTKVIVTNMFMLSMITGCGSGNKTQDYASLVTLDINPSIQLHLDDDQKVVDALALNDDAKKVLQDMDLKQADANVALNALLGSLVKNGYLNANQNTVLLSVDNDDEKERSALEDELSQYIYSTLKSYSIEGAIYAQDIEVDDDIENLMDKYSISYGKANLIDEIIDEDENQKKYKAEDLAKLNAQDLILIYQSLEADDDKNHKMLGNVNTTQYITKDEALNIALQNAALTKDKVKNLEIDYDLENGVLTYDIEFTYNQNEYEYEVNAEKGNIEKEVEPKETSTTSNKDASNYASGQTSGTSTTNKNTNYDNTNYGSAQTSGSSTTNKNTNYDNSNYGNTQTSGSSTPSKNTNYDNSNYGSTQTSGSSTTNQNTNYDNSNYGNTQTSGSSTTNQNTNYDDSNYGSGQSSSSSTNQNSDDDNSNYDDNDDVSNYDN